jgi:hypothetical protein
MLGLDRVHNICFIGRVLYLAMNNLYSFDMGQAQAENSGRKLRQKNCIFIRWVAPAMLSVQTGNKLCQNL